MKRLAVIAVAVMAQGCSNWGHMTPEEIRPENWFGSDEEKVVSNKVEYPELYDTDMIKDYSKPKRRSTQPTVPNVDWSFTVDVYDSKAQYGQFGVMCSKLYEYRKITFEIKDAYLVKEYSYKTKFKGRMILEFDKHRFIFNLPPVEYGKDSVVLILKPERYNAEQMRLALNTMTRSKQTNVIIEESSGYKMNYVVASNKFRPQKPRNWICKR